VVSHQVAPVDVAAHSDHRSDLFQPFQHAPLADVAGVDNQFNALQGSDRCLTQQAVGIGNYSNAVNAH
jgi:hypothetical protein